MRAYLILMLACCLVLPAAAVVLRNGDVVTIPAGEVINDDLVISGNTLNIQGRVNGNLVAAGQTINVTGSVADSAMLAGQTITISGTVGESAFLAGNTLTISNETRRNLFAAGNNVSLSGSVGRDAQLAGNQVTLADAARVNRDLNAAGSNVAVAAGAVIAGQRHINQGEQRERHQKPSLAWMILWPIFSGLALLLTGLLFLAVAPRLTEQTEGTLRAHPWASLLTGFLAFIVVPIAGLILLFTLVGIPLSLILFALYWIALYLGPIFLAILVGRALLRRRTGSLYLALLIGIALYILVRFIPILGGIVSFGAMLFGLGALLLAIQSRAQHPFIRFAPPAPEHQAR